VRRKRGREEEREGGESKAGGGGQKNANNISRFLREGISFSAPCSHRYPHLPMRV
jgi:hypothetical protein